MQYAHALMCLYLPNLQSGAELMREQFLNALRDFETKVEYVRNDCAQGKITMDEAARQIRNLSIDLGQISCLPYR